MRAEEGDGLTGEGLRADEIPFFAGGNGNSVRGPGFDCHAEAFALDFSRVDGQERAGGAE